MKKFVSILLAILLATGLFVPAMAEEETPPQDKPLRVSISGNYTTSSEGIARGKTIALECSFEQPEGLESEPVIEWFVGDKLVGTGSKLDLTIDKNEGNQWDQHVSVRVSAKVTYTSVDENGEELTKEGVGYTRVYVAQNLLPKVLQNVMIILLFPFAMILPALMGLGMLFGGIWNWVTGLPQWLWSIITGIFK